MGGNPLNGWTAASSLGSWRQYHTCPLRLTLPSLGGLAGAPDAEMNISEVLLHIGRLKKKKSYFSENMFYKREGSVINQVLGYLSEDGHKRGHGSGCREHFLLT